MNVLAVDIGGTKVRLGVVEVSETGTPVIRHQQDLETTGHQLSEVLKNAATLAEKLSGNLSYSKIGISTAGFLHEDRATIDQLHDGRWIQTNIADFFGEPRDRVLVLDDGMASTIAEWKSGAARQFSNTVVLTVGTKLGAGVVLNGRILHVGGYASPQLGGVIVPPEQARNKEIPFLGEECAGDALRASAQRCGYADVGDMLMRVKDDEKAAAAVERMCEYLAMCVANAVNLFAPERVVLTGGVVEKGREWVLHGVREHLEGKLLRRPRQFEATTALVEGKFGGNASLIGAALAVFADPIEPRRDDSH
jgi:glucokinase